MIEMAVLTGVKFYVPVVDETAGCNVIQSGPALVSIMARSCGWRLLTPWPGAVN